MGQGRGHQEDRGNVFVLLSILVLIVGIVSAAGLVLAVLNYTSDNDTPININVEASKYDYGDNDKEDSSHESGSDYGVVYDKPSYSTTGSNEDEAHYDSRIWTICINGVVLRRVEYIDRKSRQFKGYVIDVINEVCQIAGKNCQLIHDSWTNCWSNGLPGQGILNRYYDACALWSNSRDRQRSLKFSTPLNPTPKPVFLTLRGNPTNFDPENLRGKPIGFFTNWWADRYCLLQSTDQELDDGQILNYNSDTELVAALDSREVDAIFVSNELKFAQDGSYDVVKEVDACLVGGDSMLMRKDSLFKDWWDPAFEKLLNSRTYRGICQDLEDPAVHGNEPGRSADDICLDY